MSLAAGYSATPLANKLGIRERSRIFLIAAPPGYRDWVAPLPEGVVFARTLDEKTDLVHLFVTEREVLAAALRRLREMLRADATLWVSWPKKSAKVDTTVGENSIRELALPMGWVDVKVCAVNERWSGLKLVVRKELR